MQKHKIKIDGPFYAPAQNYHNYQDVMLVAAGVGITPSASLIDSVTRYKWRNQLESGQTDLNPRILRFYWMLKERDVKSYRWFVDAIIQGYNQVQIDKNDH